MDAFITRKRPRNIEKQGSTGAIRDPSISPPPKRIAQKGSALPGAETVDLTGDNDEERPNGFIETNRKEIITKSTLSSAKVRSRKIIASPVQLNHIQNLPASSSVDTVRLSDILGDPMIKECWLFNYLFDIEFLMCVCLHQSKNPS